MLHAQEGAYLDHFAAAAAGQSIGKCRDQQALCGLVVTCVPKMPI
jgi:hypothetical protein